MKKLRSFRIYVSVLLIGRKTIKQHSWQYYQRVTLLLVYCRKQHITMNNHQNHAKTIFLNYADKSVMKNTMIFTITFARLRQIPPHIFFISKAVDQAHSYHFGSGCLVWFNVWLRPCQPCYSRHLLNESDIQMVTDNYMYLWWHLMKGSISSNNLFYCYFKGTMSTSSWQSYYRKTHKHLHNFICIYSSIHPHIHLNLYNHFLTHTLSPKGLTHKYMLPGYKNVHIHVKLHTYGDMIYFPDNAN